MFLDLVGNIFFIKSITATMFPENGKTRNKWNEHRKARLF